MLSKIFLGMSLLGAEWVLYFLLLLSVLSVAVMIERVRFYRSAGRGLADFRRVLREAVFAKDWDKARKLANERVQGQKTDQSEVDLESELALALLSAESTGSTQALEQIAADSVAHNRLKWERNLAILATVGSNAPFIGLFGTVLGIIKAFHDLSQQVGMGAQTVTAGISEALVATAFGILVAIPAVAAYNLFQRRVKAAVTEAESTKSFLIGKIAK